MVAVDKNVRYRYDITLANRSNLRLEKLDLEYRIFYDQERAVREDGDDQPQQSRGNSRFGGQQQGFYMAVAEERVESGRLQVDALAPHARKTLPTDSVTILNRNASSSAEGELIDLEGELNGIWVKVTMKAPDGTVREREVAVPKNIVKKYAWSARPEHAADESRPGFHNRNP
ncbi:hypothetical protein PDESU_03010 [Pontiella desulfatans]|uniref:Uncharacterized protein n=1 Tax=Pontiella desulfatans TaxID=2750659 RepID=A0A6C2U362_PONDE|nr:hypothetical protein [Pontiella desulfatans]VGO14448.1 hypothetical protein PDESU_03010 [Pontiella desulfatans]